MSLKIYAVGDIMLGDRPLCNYFGVSSVRSGLRSKIGHYKEHSINLEDE